MTQIVTPLSDSITEQLSQESDRGMILLGISLIDTLLENLLRKALHGNKKHLDTLFQHYGPLGTLSAKITLSFSLNILTKEIFENLNCLRKIRNILAHNFGIHDFSHQSLEASINQLWTGNKKIDDPCSKVLFALGIAAGFIESRISNIKKIEITYQAPK